MASTAIAMELEREMERKNIRPCFFLLEKAFNGLPTLYFCRDVKLPGRSRNAPAVFPFGTEYSEMYDALSREDNEVRED